MSYELRTAYRAASVSQLVAHSVCIFCNKRALRLAMGLRQPVFPNLPALRRQKGISLDTISTATRIGKRYLEAIERGAFSVLPGGIYDISYIRQYAHAVDLDEQELLDCYFAATNLPNPAAPDATVKEDVDPVPFRPYLPLIPRALFNVSIRKLRKT